MRSDLGLGLFSPSEDGGLLELRLFIASLASNSSPLAFNSIPSAVSVMT